MKEDSRMGLETDGVGQLTQMEAVKSAGGLRTSSLAIVENLKTMVSAAHL